MNLIEAVLVFAAITAAFELVILMKLAPRTRCRVLGSTRWVLFIHTAVFAINLAVHYGSLVGSMTAITAALTSFITVPFARWLSGHIANGIYHPGVLKYTIDELK